MNWKYGSSWKPLESKMTGKVIQYSKSEDKFEMWSKTGANNQLWSWRGTQHDIVNPMRPDQSLLTFV